MRIIHPSQIRSLRSKADLTQAELGEAAGVTQAYIAKIESGKADPKISTLEKISKALRTATPREKITAGQVMEKPIISVKPDDKISKAIKLMESHDISQLPIIKNTKQVGSLAEETIIRQISAGENMFRLVEERVKQVMEDPFPTVGVEAGLDMIFPLLEHNLAVLVLNRGEPEGIITKADILQLSTDYRTISEMKNSGKSEKI
ncbi:hypothetical protein AKJ57_03930 [candidate division MSBL1 archaeon SCGC-AAA259A05]|uniref:CBS domain-containing protein n=1 Tax=candidate division MSBL1 archaeon SCGC-AAA259A05 TaxID=1698259 RepID=A0A133U960_9EURY|nr:hypothetical protein AKJ57_03930 [candidate division MSBL1 archaeon SCGC-AAA259A05]